MLPSILKAPILGYVTVSHSKKLFYQIFQGIILNLSVATYGFCLVGGIRVTTLFFGLSIIVEDMKNLLLIMNIRV